MSEAKGMDINVMGREFRVACPDEERAALTQAVKYLDARMREIRDSGKVIGIERIAIMVALNIVHEHLTGGSSKDFDTNEFKRRIQAIEASIDEAMAKQDELF
ncbi:MAG: cell division protein ZapA [Burkholderiales bacterium]